MNFFPTAKERPLLLLTFPHYEIISKSTHSFKLFFSIFFALMLSVRGTQNQVKERPPLLLTFLHYKIISKSTHSFKLFFRSFSLLCFQRAGHKLSKGKATIVTNCPTYLRSHFKFNAPVQSFFFASMLSLRDTKLSKGRLPLLLTFLANLSRALQVRLLCLITAYLFLLLITSLDIMKLNFEMQRTLTETRI